MDCYYYKKANFHTNDVIQWLTTKDEYAKRLFLLRWVKHITSVPRHNGIDEKHQYAKFKNFKIMFTKRSYSSSMIDKNI